MEDEVDLVFGLLGMVVGAAVGGATCHEGDGLLETRSEALSLVATKPGYLAERHTLYFPHDQPQLTIRLIPDPNAQLAAEPAPFAAQDAQVSDPSADRRPAHAPTAEPMGLPIRRPGLTIYPVQAEVRYGEPDPGLADGLTLLLVAELDRVGFTGASPAAGAELVLQSRLLEVGDLCILSANLHRADDSSALRVASARGPCSPAALQQAVERLAAQLAAEDGTELAAQ